MWNNKEKFWTLHNVPQAVHYAAGKEVLPAGIEPATSP